MTNMGGTAATSAGERSRGRLLRPTVTARPRHARANNMHLQGAAFISAHTLTWDATLFIRRSASGVWDLARGDSPLWPESRMDGVDDQAARHALDTLFAPMAVGG